MICSKNLQQRRRTTIHTSSTARYIPSRKTKKHWTTYCQHLLPEDMMKMPDIISRNLKEYTGKRRNFSTKNICLTKRQETRSKQRTFYKRFTTRILDITMLPTN